MLHNLTISFAMVMHEMKIFTEKLRIRETTWKCKHGMSNAEVIGILMKAFCK